MNNQKIFRKNNYIIESIKKKSKESKINNLKFENDKICSFKSISLKTFILFCCTILSVLTSYTILTEYMIANITSISKINIFIKTVFLSCFLIELILFFLSNIVSLQYQKTIAISIALTEGITLGFFLNLLKLYYSNFMYGIAFAFISTIMLFMIVHLLYTNNIITVNNKFRMFFIISLLILFITKLLLNLISSYSNNSQDMFINEQIFFIFSICFLILGCMSLALDFDDANFIVSQKIHKDNEWRVALGFHMNLIYIFIQCIILLIKLGFFKKKEY